jgi:hypothetical protein
MGNKRKKIMIMTFREQLVELDACYESLKWVKNKTIEEAWKTCENSEWMIWLLNQTGLDLIDPVCEITERVLHLVPEDGQLACIWAISATRRRASKDELAAAYVATCNAASYYVDAAHNATLSRTAAYCCAINACCDVSSVASAAYYGTALTYADSSYYCADDTAYRREQKKQCDILRKYFTIDQVKKAFNKLVS